MKRKSDYGITNLVKSVKFSFSNEKDMELLKLIEETGMPYSKVVKTALFCYFNRSTPILNKKPERRKLNILNQLKNIRK